MTNTTLAGYSNLALYTCLAVLAVALVCYAIDLAHAREWAADADEVAGTAASVPGKRVRRPWAGVGFSTTALATLLLVGAIVLRGASVKRWPLGNMYEFCMTGCAFMLAAFLVWASRKDVRWLGLFITGPVILTLAVAVGKFYTPAAQLMPSLRSVWIVIHVTIATLSTALFGIGAVLTVLYLLQLRRQEKGAAGPAWLAAMPAPKVLDRYAYAMHIISFPLWTFTVIAGAIWAQQAWGRYWGWDPKEVWSFVIFVVYAAYLHARATSGWNARRAAWLALAGMLCLILNFAVVNVFFVGMHSYSGM